VKVYGMIDSIDKALNEIDRRMKNHPSPSERAALGALRDRLTSDSRYDEDSIAKPDRLRERVFGLTGPLGGNLQPPFEQHEAALDALRLDSASVYSQIASVLGAQFAATIGMHPLNLPANAIIVAPKPAPTSSP